VMIVELRSLRSSRTSSTSRRSASVNGLNIGASVSTRSVLVVETRTTPRLQTVGPSKATADVVRSGLSASPLTEVAFYCAKSPAERTTRATASCTGGTRANVGCGRSCACAPC
jgi:hypothetical protein